MSRIVQIYYEPFDEDEDDKIWPFKVVPIDIISEKRLRCDLRGRLIEGDWNDWDQLPDDDEDIEETAYQLSEKVRNQVEILPERQREAMLLHHYAGKTLDDTGVIMDITHQAVSRLTQRAVSNLQKAVTADQTFSELLARCRFTL